MLKPHLANTLRRAQASAEASGSPWAAWAGLGSGPLTVYVCLGGVVEARGGGALRAQEGADRPRALRSWGPRALDAPHIAALPSELSAWRFDDSRADAHTERGRAWGAWGERGWSWRPALTLSYQASPKGGAEIRVESSAEGRAEGIDLIKGLELVVACAWSAEGEALWSSFDRAQLESDEALQRAPLGAAAWEPGEPEEAWVSRARRAALRCAEDGPLEKVVLAREVSCQAPAGQRWDPLASWVASLSGAPEGSCAFLISLGAGEALVGLTPERLVEVRAGRFKTHALAGTRARRGESGPKLEALERELSAAPKDLHEHQLVVDELSARLRPFARSVKAELRRVKRLKSLLHLETPISGELKEGCDPIALIEALHPTPALGGAPRAEALTYLREHEPLERGGYAAPWCWRSEAGDLSAYVVIRSALLRGREARLYAGAGVVASSDPQLEWRETEDKLSSIVSSLRLSPLPSQALINLSASLELIRRLKTSGRGLAGAVISPGSRSTPLALAADALLETQLIIDERAAGFYALGWARAARAPVALICTSGSAGAHYLPALIEAYQAGVPLLALTADRPEELLGLGAPQTIDQRALFGRFVKQAWPLSAPRALSASAPSAHGWGETAEAAASLAVAHPEGPVHLNLPFEEPLWGPELEGPLASARAEGRAPARALPQLQAEEDEPSGALPAVFSGARGLIYCGPLLAPNAQELAPHIARLSELLDWPVWAEASSQLRGCEALAGRLICWAERGARLGALPPASELTGLLMIGAPPHARAVNAWLRAWAEGLERDGLGRDGLGGAKGWERGLAEAPCLLLGERPEPANPLRLPAAWVSSRPLSALRAWCRALLEGPAPTEARREASAAWRATWRALDEQLDPQRGPAPLELSSGLWGGSIGLTLSQALEAQAPHLTARAQLHVASSTAFRDLDMTLSPLAATQVEVWSQRGANGIDGTLCAALGSLRASALDAPLLVWIGDTAAHHDLAGLVAWGASALHQARSAPATILLVNNGGGGIFGLLPIKHSERFEELFLTPIETHQRCSWEGLAAQLGFDYEAPSGLEGLREALERSLRPAREGTLRPRLIELFVDRALDLAQRRDYWSAARSTLTREEAQS